MLIPKYNGFHCTNVYACVPNYFSCIQLFANLWTIACQTPLSTGFSRQECLSRLLCPLPGDLSDSGIKLTSITPPALAGGFFTTSTTWEAHIYAYIFANVCTYAHKWHNMPIYSTNDKAHLIRGSFKNTTQLLLAILWIPMSAIRSK